MGRNWCKEVGRNLDKEKVQDSGIQGCLNQDSMVKSDLLV